MEYPDVFSTRERMAKLEALTEILENLLQKANELEEGATQRADDLQYGPNPIAVGVGAFVGGVMGKALEDDRVRTERRVYAMPLNQASNIATGIHAFAHLGIPRLISELSDEDQEKAGSLFALADQAIVQCPPGYKASEIETTQAEAYIANAIRYVREYAVKLRAALEDFSLDCMSIEQAEVVRGEFSKRHFILAEADQGVANGLEAQLLKERGTASQPGVDRGVVRASDADSVQGAIDDFVAVAQGGETLTLMVGLEIFNTTSNLYLHVNPQGAGVKAIQYAQNSLDAWNKSHHEEKPLQLEIAVNDRPGDEPQLTRERFVSDMTKSRSLSSIDGDSVLLPGMWDGVSETANRIPPSKKSPRPFSKSHAVRTLKSRFANPVEREADYVEGAVVSGIPMFVIKPADKWRDYEIEFPSMGSVDQKELDAEGLYHDGCFTLDADAVTAKQVFDRAVSVAQRPGATVVTVVKDFLEGRRE